MEILFWLLYKHFWLAAIGVNFLNGFMLKERFKTYIQKKPELEEGYINIYRGFVFYYSLPFVAMGIGMIFGDFKNFFDFMFGGHIGNPFVMLFYGTLIMVWILSAIWIYCLGGAEFLAEHPGVFKNATPSATEIKIQTILLLVGATIFIVIAFSDSGFDKFNF